MTEWSANILGFVSCALLCFCVFQQLFFMSQIHKLVDKVMSRSFEEYKRAEKPQEKVKVQLPLDPAEDLQTLQEFRMG